MNQRGETFSFTMNMLLILGFLLPIFAIFVTDYMIIGNIKQSVDNEFKRAVTEAIVVYINDRESTDRKASMSSTEQSDMEEMIQATTADNLKANYNMDITFTDVDLLFTDKIYVTYKGYVLYSPMIANVARVKTKFEIHVKGRSKAQRFDD